MKIREEWHISHEAKYIEVVRIFAGNFAQFKRTVVHSFKFVI